LVGIADQRPTIFSAALPLIRKLGRSKRNKTIGIGVHVIVRLVRICCVLAISLVSSEAVSAQTALQLFHEMQLALGGAENISAIHD